MRHLDFAVIVVPQAAIRLNARDADQRNVHLELTYEVHRGLAHNALVSPAHHAADHNHFALWVDAKNACHIEVVGDHPQSRMLNQRPGDGLGGGADVENQRAVIGHGGGYRFGDAGLAGCVQADPLLVRHVLYR